MAAPEATLRGGSRRFWPPSAATPEELDSERERAGLLRQQRLKTEFEVGILKGRYVDADEVEAADAVIFAALRDRIQAVSSIAPLLVQAAMQGGELAVKRTLAEALDAALEEIGTAEIISDGAAHTQGM